MSAHAGAAARRAAARPAAQKSDDERIAAFYSTPRPGIDSSGYNARRRHETFYRNSMQTKDFVNRRRVLLALAALPVARLAGAAEDVDAKRTGGPYVPTPQV